MSQLPINQTDIPIRDWSEVKSLDIGLKVLKISGELLRYMQTESDDFNCFWLELKSKLPRDVCLIAFLEHCLLNDSVSYQDVYSMVLGSKKWEMVAEGGMVPDLEITFDTTYMRTRANREQSSTFYRLYYRFINWKRRTLQFI